MARAPSPAAARYSRTMSGSGSVPISASARFAASVTDREPLPATAIGGGVSGSENSRASSTVTCRPR
ncbi:MAG TPA: hypothetical protein VK875_10415 [Euzebyales bacterium]|nr:hypothetical protein [Euzebyales bacterium]